jgi:hypothetical protein
VRVFRQKFTLEDAIGSHACSLEANMRVTNGIPLGSSLLLPVCTVTCVQTLKVKLLKVHDQLLREEREQYAREFGGMGVGTGGADSGDSGDSGGGGSSTSSTSSNARSRTKRLLLRLLMKGLPLVRAGWASAGVLYQILCMVFGWRSIRRILFTACAATGSDRVQCEA